MNNLKRLYENQGKLLNRNLLIVDMNNVLHKAIHAHPHLHCNYKDNKIYTGGLYGFVQQVSTAIEKFNIDDMIICTDQPPYMRSLLLKEYKAKREKPSIDFKKKFHDTINLINNFVIRANIILWSKLGFEADDLIYMLCSYYSKDYGKIVILSNDKDLYQTFIFDNIFLVKNGYLYGQEQFMEEYDVSVSDWVWITVFSGGHNGVPGFDGIGEKTAIKLAKQNPRKWNLYGVPNNLVASDNVSEFIFDNFNKIKLYYHLAKLPFFYGGIQSNDFQVPKIKNPTEESIVKANIFLQKLKFNI